MDVLPTRPDVPVDLAQLERAIGQMLVGTGDADRLARELGLTRDALADLVRRYRAGGRAAIGR
jgi:hypothetical protein